MGRPQVAPCLQCRYRKVRCDRRQRKCGNCERLGFDCSFQQRTVTPERRRANRACFACRRLKVRCSGEPLGCATCRQHRWQCCYAMPGLREKSHMVGDSASPLFPISRQELLQAIDRFFYHLYPITSFAFLHEPSTRQLCLNGTLDPHLSLSLVAVTNVYLSSDKGLLDKCASWVKIVETDFWDYLQQPSILRVQTLLFVVHYYIQTGEFSRAYMLAGLAGRAAIALRLNHNRPELTFVAQEMRRRVIWSLTHIDCYFAVGLTEYETIPYAIIYQQLPCSEEEFCDGDLQSTIELDQPKPVQRLKLLGTCLQISKIQRDVMRLTRQLKISEKSLVDLPGLAQEIQNDLCQLHAELELTSNFSISATAKPLEMAHSRWFTRYLLASLSWHQVHCDLFRIFLPGYAEAAPKAILDVTDPTVRQHAIEMCCFHVQRIFEILLGVLKQVDVPVLPFYVAICAYQATRLALFLLSVSTTAVPITAKFATNSSKTALGIMHKFFPAAPLAHDIIDDLQRLVHSTYSLSPTTGEPICAPLARSDGDRHQYDQLSVHSLFRQSKFLDESYDS